MAATLVIPFVSTILGLLGLVWAVRTGISKSERDELEYLRQDNKEKTAIIKELRDQNIYLLQRVAGVPQPHMEGG